MRACGPKRIGYPLWSIAPVLSHATMDLRPDLTVFSRVLSQLIPGWERSRRRYTSDPVRGSAALRGTALLAQSVEHSHGKAGVVGSIPTEGSTKVGFST